MRHMNYRTSALRARSADPSAAPVAPPNSAAPVAEPVVVPAAPPAAPAGTLPPSGYLTQEQAMALVEQARSDEKTKLYSTLENVQTEFKSAKETLDVLRQEKEARDEQAAKEQAEREAEAQRLADEKLTAQQLVEKLRKDSEDRFADIERERDAERALFAKERQRSELVAYTQQQVALNKEKIAPQFVGYIDGSSKEEIDGAIATAIQNTASILEEVQAAQGRARSVTPGVAPTAGNLSQLDSLGQTPREVTAEYINSLPVNSPEYAALRKQAGLDRSAAPGMFG